MVPPTLNLPVARTSGYRTIRRFRVEFICDFRMPTHRPAPHSSRIKSGHIRALQSAWAKVFVNAEPKPPAHAHNWLLARRDQRDREISDGTKSLRNLCGSLLPTTHTKLGILKTNPRLEVPASPPAPPRSTVAFGGGRTPEPFRRTKDCTSIGRSATMRQAQKWAAR